MTTEKHKITRQTNKQPHLNPIVLNFTIISYQNFHRVILKVRFPFSSKSAMPNSGFFPLEV